MKLYGVVSGLFLSGTLWEFAAKPKMASKRRVAVLRPLSVNRNTKKEAALWRRYI